MKPIVRRENYVVIGQSLHRDPSAGILSAKNRTVAVDEIEHKGLIQTDAPINPGNTALSIDGPAGRVLLEPHPGIQGGRMPDKSSGDARWNLA